MTTTLIAKLKECEKLIDESIEGEYLHPDSHPGIRDFLKSVQATIALAETPKLNLTLTLLTAAQEAAEAARLAGIHQDPDGEFCPWYARLLEQIKRSEAEKAVVKPKKGEPTIIAELQTRTFDGDGFGAPSVSLVVTQEGEGGPVRILLGGGEDQPDTYIERQKDRWSVVIHPGNGTDPLLGVEVMDDGRAVVEDSMGKQLAEVEP